MAESLPPTWETSRHPWLPASESDLADKPALSPLLPTLQMSKIQILIELTVKLKSPPFKNLLEHS